MSPGPLGVEPYRPSGELEKCPDCNHKWHGLPCEINRCLCPSAYKGPTE